MARQTKEARLAAIHAEALRQFDAIQSAVMEERKQCLQDRRFYSISGAQWEGNLGEQFANKPKFEVNKVHLSVIRIFNEYRNNRITVDFVSKDGSDNGELADVCDGLYRADEQDSCAEEAYDNAFEEGVGGGFGAWRLRAEYEDEDDEENENQRIKIEPIYDADSCVFFDLNAKRQDKSDANHCFVLTGQTVQSYIDEWGDDPASWPKDIDEAEYDWFTPDIVYVAEYYRVEMVRDTIRTFVGLDGSQVEHDSDDFDEDEELEDTLEATGFREIETRKGKKRKIHKYIMSGGKILEDCGFIAGRHIPIVPFYGKRWFVDGVERCMGHVRLAKDAQRLKNMQISKLGEISALSAVEKPILNPEQIAGHQLMWTEDNLKNYPYLLVNSITDSTGNALPSGPLAYTKPPQIPQAMAALLQVTEQDMQEILGSSQQADKMVSGVSGKAVELIQTRLDMQSFIYMSNMAKAMRRCGEIWLPMAKELYSKEGRSMKVIGDKGEVGNVKMMQPYQDDDMAVVFKNDLSEATFDVAVDVGPSSVSRREATVKALTGMMALTTDPETLSVLQAMALMNMEGEGLADAKEFYRKKLVNMGVLKPNDEEAEAMAKAASEAQPDPQALYLQAAAEEASANADKKRAETIGTMATADLNRAKTLEIAQNMETVKQDQVVNFVKVLSGNLPTASMGEIERMQQ